MSKQRPSAARQFTAEDVRLMLSSPVYGYGINLMPAERVAEVVLKLNTQLAQKLRDTGTTFTLAELDQRFQALLQELEESGTCIREEDYPPIMSNISRVSLDRDTLHLHRLGAKGC